MKKIIPPLLLSLTWIADPIRSDAADLPRSPEDYAVTSWGQKDGLPSGGVHAIAQDSHGYLWLGTNAGLFRFDGISFVSWETVGQTPLPNRPVHHLTYSRDGSLWLAFGAEGGVSQILDGAARNYDEQSGLLSGAVTSLVEDRDRTIWVGNPRGLFQLRAGQRQWEQIGPQDGLPHGGVFSLYLDGKANLVVGMTGAVFRRSGAHAAFEQLEITEDLVMGIAEDSSGSLCITDPVTALKRVGDPPSDTPGLTRGRGYVLLNDRRGGLWAGTMGQGLWRIPPNTHAPSAGATREAVLIELLGDWVLGLVEDRDGNIWAGTYEGLNRLTRFTVMPIRGMRTASAVEMTPDGSVWVATADTMIRFVKAKERWESVRQFRVSGLRALHVDERGTVWIATNRELFYLANGQLIRALSSADAKPLSQISLITSDLDGGIWLYSRLQGLFHWEAGKIRTPPAAQAPEAMPALSAYTDSTGHVWFTLGRGGIRVADKAGNSRTYSVRDGLDEHDYGIVYEDRHHDIWLGGRGALSRVREGRIETVNSRNGFPGEIVRSIVEDGNGFFWIGTGSGIIRMDPSDFDKAITSSTYQIRYSLYDTSDGVNGLPVFHGSRSAIRTPDGLLWFVTARGLTIVDPSALTHNRPAAPVNIDTVSADGRPLRSHSQVVLSARTESECYG